MAAKPESDFHCAAVAQVRVGEGGFMIRCASDEVHFFSENDVTTPMQLLSVDERTMRLCTGFPCKNTASGMPF